jgi:acetyl-CoA carboxylase carboxyl transferase subunit alpha
MKITSEDLKSLGIIDGIIPEPLGGAHRDPDSVIAATGDVIANALGELSSRSGEQIRNDRRQKFLNMGRNL